MSFVFCWFWLCVFFQSVRWFLSEILHNSEEHHLSKGNQLAEDQPYVDHLDVRGGGRPSILLRKMVVITSMVVRFTLKAASKKNGLKKVVA